MTTTPLERHAASVAAFRAHRVASDAARVAGACWPCCWFVR